MSLNLINQTLIKFWLLHFSFFKNFTISWKCFAFQSSINDVIQCWKWNNNEIIRLWMRRESVLNFNIRLKTFFLSIINLIIIINLKWIDDKFQRRQRNNIKNIEIDNDDRIMFFYRNFVFIIFNENEINFS